MAGMLATLAFFARVSVQNLHFHMVYLPGGLVQSSDIDTSSFCVSFKLTACSLPASLHLKSPVTVLGMGRYLASISDTLPLRL